MANTIHPRIQVTLPFSKKQLEFLDVHTSFVNNVVTADLFSKPTDKHIYLHMCPSHPESTKKAISYGLGVQIKRICSSNDNYLRHRKNLKSHIKDRGYNANFIEDELGKVDATERNDLLRYNNKENKTKMVPLVITFSRALPNIRRILWKHIKMIQTSDRMKQIFTEAQMLAFKRHRNVQDILVHKKTQ